MFAKQAKNRHQQRHFANKLVPTCRVNYLLPLLDPPVPPPPAPPSPPPEVPPLVGVPPLPLLFIPLVPGVDVELERVVPSVFWSELCVLVLGPLLSTGSVGPVDPANAELAVAARRPASVRAVSFCLIMM